MRHLSNLTPIFTVMATTEVLEFLNWLQENGKQDQCLEQGEQWSRWASSEGFDAKAILEGLHENNETSDNGRTFLDFIRAPEDQQTAFKSWIGLLLSHSDGASPDELKGYAGGRKEKNTGGAWKENVVESKRLYKQHLNKELAEANVDLNPIRENTAYTYTSWNKTKTYTYSGQNEQAQIQFENEGAVTSITGYSNYKGNNPYHLTNISGRIWTGHSYIKIGMTGSGRYYDGSNNVVVNKDSSLIGSVARIENRSINKVNSTKDILGTDIDPRTDNLFINSRKATQFKDLHATEYQTAKGFLQHLDKVNLSSLNNRQKIEIFIDDKQAAKYIKNHQAAVDSEKEKLNNELLTEEQRANSALDRIEGLQTELSDAKKVFLKVQDETKDYLALFARQRGNTDKTKNYHLVHYKSYKDQYKYAKNHAENSNYDYGENFLKRRANLTAKREELFGKSEARAVKNASKTYQDAKKQGLSKKACLDMAVATYLKSIIGEDLDFLLNKKDKFKADKSKWNSMTSRQRSKYLNPVMMTPRLRDERFDHAVAHDVGDVLLSVGADILQRQVDVAKKAYRDQQSHFSALRLEMLVSRLTMEFTLAERYDNWYAKHPLKEYHPVKKWFASAWADIWDTITLPYRVAKAEIKGWESGDTFWQGMKAGMNVEGNILHQDIHGFNHMVKGFDSWIAPMFNWIPGVSKMVKTEHLIGRAIEGIPFHLAKNVTSLGKQLWKVVTLQASFKGIWDGMGRDTRGIRHMVRHVDWLMHDVFTGNWSNIGNVFSRDYNDAKQGIKIYKDRKMIKAAIVIKHNELVVRRTLHRHFRHAVKSPMRMITDGVVYNLKNDKAFVDFRQSYSTSKDVKIVLKAAGKAKVLAGTLRKISIAGLMGDLQKQFKGLSFKQKAALINDYKHSALPWKEILTYEKQYLGPKLQQIEKILPIIPGILRTEVTELKSVMHQILVSTQEYIKSNQASMQKKAQTWLLSGALLTWAKEVDKTFWTSTKEGITFLRSPQSRVFQAKAMDDYFLYRERQTLKKERYSLQEELKSDTDLNNTTRKDYNKARADYKLYEKKKSYFNRQWNKWGRHDGKTALVAYDITFRPQFTVNLNTTPPTVTCSPLSSKTSKTVNANIKNKHVGYRFFMRLMWTQLWMQSTKLRSTTRDVVKRTDLLILEIKSSKKVASFFASHIILKDLIKYEDGAKIKALKSAVKKAIHRETFFINLMNVQVSEINQKNFELFEAHQFTNIKMLELQAALAYDFDATTNSKGDKEPSRYKEMKANAKKHNTYLTADYNADKAEQREDKQNKVPGLTIGQALMSVEVPPTTAPPHTLKQQWSEIVPFKSSSNAGSGGTGGSTTQKSDSSIAASDIWIKLPHNSTSDPTHKTTANIMMLWGQSKMIRHLTHKKEKAGEGEKVASEKGEKVASEKAENKGLDFDSLTTGEVDIAEHELNREAIRLDDDLNLFKDEIAEDEEITENIIETEIKTTEEDILSSVDHDLVNKGDELVPDQDGLDPVTELSEFGNTLIDTETKDVTDAIDKDVDSTVEDAEAEAEADAEAAEIVVEEIALL